MSAHGDQIKSVLGISALVSFYGIASLAVVFLGPSIGLTYIWEIVIIALLLLTWPLAILINHWRKRRAAKREAAQAVAQETGGAQPAPVKGGGAPKRIHEELARGAEEAVQWLRSTRLAGAKSSDAKQRSNNRQRHCALDWTRQCNWRACAFPSIWYSRTWTRCPVLKSSSKTERTLPKFGVRQFR